jgi:hypothetical protein
MLEDYTTDIGEFSVEALQDSTVILMAVAEFGFPDEYVEQGVVLAYNPYNGDVGLLNIKGQFTTTDVMGHIQMVDTEEDELEFDSIIRPFHNDY